VTTEHRKAPRQDVVQITREGAWGKVEYRHLLSCGHTETRARAASTPKLACAWCLRAVKKDGEMKALTAGAVPTDIDDNVKFVEEEIDISKMKAAIASKFKIPLEAIDIVATDISGNLVVKHALVFLSSSDVARITKPNPT
jgi:hypothetical protein